MKTSTLFLTFLMLALTLNLYSQQTQTVTDEGKSYSVEIPSGWVHGVSKNIYVSVLVCSDTLHAGEILNITDAKNSSNLEKAYKVNKNAMSDLKKFTILEEGNSTIGGQESKWFAYTFDSKDGTVHMKGKYYTVKYSGRGFSIQYLMPEKRFDEMKGTFEKMISTLKFN